MRRNVHTKPTPNKASVELTWHRTKAPSPIKTFAAGLFQLKGNKEQRWKQRRKLLEKRLQSDSLMATKSSDSNGTVDVLDQAKARGKPER